MGAIIKMITNVRCYNFNDVTRLLDIDNDMQKLIDFLELIETNGAFVFTPPKSIGSGRARPKRKMYIKSNIWFERFIKEKNIWGILIGKRKVKHSYKKYESTEFSHVLFE